jgi:hypothetical protein
VIESICTLGRQLLMSGKYFDDTDSLLIVSEGLIAIKKGIK